MTDAPTIHQSIAAVLAELPAIGKNQRNQQQGFSFRGIDDVLDALNPLLAKHGVFFVPTVIERLESERQLQSGKTMWVVDLHVRYTFYGPAGDSVEATAWGEGTDMGDKATQKAMTGAMKYVLFQVFAIATHEQADSDADLTTPEPTRRQSSPPQESAAAGTSPSQVSEVPAISSKALIAALKSRAIAINDAERVKRMAADWQLPGLNQSDPKQLELWGEMLREIELEMEAPFQVNA